MIAASSSFATCSFLSSHLSHERQLTLAVGRKPRLSFVSTKATASSSAPTLTRESEIELENRKFELLTAVTDTNRGLNATPEQRSSVEETLVSIESFNAGKPIELRLLDGTWRLQYTSASDVLILLQSAATLPFFEVDQIYQKFECGDQSTEGVVRNIVRWSIPRLLEDIDESNEWMVGLMEDEDELVHQGENLTWGIATEAMEQEGATLLVSAKFSVVSSRNIYLEFEEIAVENIKISEDVQALIAPAILPRSFLSLQILQFIRSFKAQFPVRSSQRRSVGGLYYLSYLDSNMLMGRAVGGGGVFVFTRAQPFV